MIAEWFRLRRDRKIARLEAVVEAYEQRIQHKNTLIRETELMRQEAVAELHVVKAQLDNTEDINKILVEENASLQQERDWLADAVRQMYAESEEANRKADESRSLDRENQRIWQENVALREALTRLDPERARWICGRK